MRPSPPKGGRTAGYRRTWERGLRCCLRGVRRSWGQRAVPHAAPRGVPVTEPRVSCYIVIKASREHCASNRPLGNVRFGDLGAVCREGNSFLQCTATRQNAAGRHSSLRSAPAVQQQLTSGPQHSRHTTRPPQSLTECNPGAGNAKGFAAAHPVLAPHLREGMLSLPQQVSVAWNLFRQK